MKLLFGLASLFAVAQAQLSIGAPTPGATIHAGQNVTIQLVVPALLSEYAGQLETGLVIGFVNCSTSGCPAPSADLGYVQFIGKFEIQDRMSVSTGINFIDNVNVMVPNVIFGNASIQVQHSYAIQTPAHAQPFVEYKSVGVQVS